MGSAKFLIWNAKSYVEFGIVGALGAVILSLFNLPFFLLAPLLILILEAYLYKYDLSDLVEYLTRTPVLFLQTVLILGLIPAFFMLTLWNFPVHVYGFVNGVIYFWLVTKVMRL